MKSTTARDRRDSKKTRECSGCGSDWASWKMLKRGSRERGKRASKRKRAIYINTWPFRWGQDGGQMSSGVRFEGPKSDPRWRSLTLSVIACLLFLSGTLQKRERESFSLSFFLLHCLCVVYWNVPVWIALQRCSLCPLRDEVAYCRSTLCRCCCCCCSLSCCCSRYCCCCCCCWTL